MPQGGPLFWRQASDPIYDRADVREEMREGARIIEQQGIRDPAEALWLAKDRRSRDQFLNAKPSAVYEETGARANAR